MEQLKNNNRFLVACVSCVVILLMFCYFGINMPVKTTYSASFTCPTNTKAYEHKLFDTNVCIRDDNPAYISEGSCIYDNTNNSIDTATLEKNGYIHSGFNTYVKVLTQDNFIDNICLFEPVQSGSSIYFIKYDSNGGEYSGGATVISRDKIGGQNYIIPSDILPTKVGYTFVGWNTQSDGKGTSYNAGSTYSQDKDLVLYAQWEDETPKDETTISLDPKEETYNGSAIEAEIADTNSSGTVTYTYYTDINCTKKTIKDNKGINNDGDAPVDVGTYYVIATVAASNGMSEASTSCTKHTIKQKEISVSWSGSTTFTYDGKEKGPTAAASTGVAGETLNLTTTKATTSGSYTSRATCSSVTGGRVNCNNYKLTNTTKSFTINEKVDDTPEKQTLTATFDAKGGSLDGNNQKTCTATVGSSCQIDNLPTASKDGYTFNGWSLGSECKITYSNEVSISGDTVYVACYTKNAEEPPKEEPKDETPKDENVDTNPTTGDIAIAITWFVGMLAVGYSFYYFRSIKEN